MKFSLIIPAYNEEKSIEKFVDKINQIEFDSNFFEIIFVDDGSEDKTKKLIENNLKNIKYKSEIISHTNNIGYGASLKTGIKKASTDIIAICDIDSTYPIYDLKKMFEIFNEQKLDMIIGERVFENNSDNFLKKIARNIIRSIIKVIVNEKISDFNSGLRIFKKKYILDKISFYPEKFSFTTTSTILMMLENKKVDYIPIKYFKREGNSKIKPSDFFRFIKLVFYLAFSFKPFKVLLPLNLLISLFSILSLIADILSKNITDTTVILIFLSTNLFLLSYNIDIIQRVIRKLK